MWKVNSVQVVPYNSARLPGYIPIGIRANHMDMTKFDNADNPGFKAVAGELQRWVKALTQAGMTSNGPPTDITEEATRGGQNSSHSIRLTPVSAQCTFLIYSLSVRS